MYRINIHNLITDQRYEFQAPDQEAIDTKLASEPCYGKPAWTETIPAWLDYFANLPPDDPKYVPGVEHPEQIIEHPSERIVTIAEIDESPARLTAAWVAANAYAREGMDENSRASLLWLAVDPECPQWRRDRIVEVQAWWSALWSIHYAEVRIRIVAGEDARFDPTIVGICPWTIWQIAGAIP